MQAVYFPSSNTYVTTFTMIIVLVSNA